MSPTAASEVIGYWYPDSQDQEPARNVLQAVRDYRAAELKMRQRIRDEMKLTEKDMMALRHLVHAHQQGTDMGPTDLSRALSISSASTTALIDRLVNSGHIQRKLHPTDRRALKLVPTDRSSTEIQTILGSLHERMMNVASALSADEAEVVARFLHLLTETVDKEPEGRRRADPLTGCPS